MQPLHRIVAVVTGASRGAGRGIAGVLGEAGATVYVTGRSVRGAATSTLPNTTIEDTADMVTARGRRGIAVACDHTVDAHVAALFAQVQQEQGRLDLLVNNAWGGYEDYDDTFDALFWEQPLMRFDKMWTAGVRSTMVSSYYGVQLMLPQRHGLIVHTTLDVGINDWDLDRHGLINVFYDTAKTTLNRMAFGMAHNLRAHNVAVVAIGPGWMRTEGVLENFRTGVHTAEEWEHTKSVEYIGRAVAALAADPQRMQQTGRILRAGEVARLYNFMDIDGRQPA